MRGLFLGVSLMIGAGSAFAGNGSLAEVDGGLTKEKAIAFGSILLVNQFGQDQSEWKEVDAFSRCDLSGSSRLALHSGDEDDLSPPPPQDPVPFPPPPGQCGYSVYYTTLYRVETCPNGDLRIVRGGVGIDLFSIFEGEEFHWREAANCDDSTKDEHVISSGSKPSMRPFALKYVRRN